MYRYIIEKKGLFSTDQYANVGLNSLWLINNFLITT